jgi:hypothetical protein
VQYELVNHLERQSIWPVATMLTFRTEKISPQLAASYLALNKQNRPVREAAVAEMAADIRARRWRTTHQGIAFDWDGNLRDGQHRLQAIIEANLTVEMVVTRGIDPEACDAIDLSRRRTFTDFEVLSGNRDFTKGHEATLRAMFAIEGKWSSGASVPDLRAHWAIYKDAIEFSMNLFASRAQGGFQPGTNNGIVRAVVARAWYTQDHARLEQFVEIMRTGLSNGSGDEAAVKLRNLLLSGVSGSRQDRTAVYRKTERALLSFLQGLPLKKIYETQEELFPFPGEAKASALQEPQSKQNDNTADGPIGEARV